MIPVRRILDENRRVITPLIVVLLVNVALYAVAVYPLERRVAGAQQRAANAAAARRSAERDLTVARATIEGKDRADQELQKFYKEVLPVGQGAARRATYLRLSRLAREAELNPEHRARFEPLPVKDSRLTQLKTTLDLAGNYRAIRRFIYLLETAPEFTIIDNVTLAHSGEGGGLRITLELSTYYWSPAGGE